MRAQNKVEKEKKAEHKQERLKEELRQQQGI